MKFYKAGKIPEVPNMYFIYGDGGTGKTSLLKEFNGKKIIYSFDLSTNPLKDCKDTDFRIFESADAPNIQNMVSGFLGKDISSGQYSVVCLDNVTALQNLVLENIDNASKDNRQNYQKLQLWFRSMAMFLRQSNVTVYATAHQIDNGAAGLTGAGRYGADMNEKTFNAFTSVFDFVGRLYVQDNQRWIDCNPESGNHGKNRIDDRKKFHAEELIKPKEENKKQDEKGVA